MQPSSAWPISWPTTRTYRASSPRTRLGSSRSWRGKRGSVTWRWMSWRRNWISRPEMTDWASLQVTMMEGTSCPRVPSVAFAMSMNDIAILVYQASKRRSDDDSFDGLGNMGVEVIADVLKRAGMAVGYCSPESAHEHCVVLVSMTSTYDLLAFTQAVGKLPSWKLGGRKFKVVAGGAGMQNPTTVRRWIDYAAFGRADGFAVDLIAAALDGRPFANPSVMNLPDLTPATLGQSELYPHAIKGRTESFMGCKRKCKFCHYSWARKYRGPAGDYLQTSVSAASPEVTWDRLLGIDRKHGRIRTALDGFSERLRHVYGKQITNDDVVAGIEKAGAFGGVTTVLAYNIS